MTIKTSDFNNLKLKIKSMFTPDVVTMIKILFFQSFILTGAYILSFYVVNNSVYEQVKLIDGVEDYGFEHYLKSNIDPSGIWFALVFISLLYFFISILIMGFACYLASKFSIADSNNLCALIAGIFFALIATILFFIVAMNGMNPRFFEPSLYSTYSTSPFKFLYMTVFGFVSLYGFSAFSNAVFLYKRLRSR